MSVFGSLLFLDVTQNFLVVCWSLITNQRCVNSQKNENLKYPEGEPRNLNIFSPSMSERF